MPARGERRVHTLASPTLRALYESKAGTGVDPHYQGALGEAACTAAALGVLLASGGDDESPKLKCKTAPTLKQARAKRVHRDHSVICSPNLRTIRGGVIARLQIRTRQKLKRPLRSIRQAQSPVNEKHRHGRRRD